MSPSRRRPTRAQIRQRARRPQRRSHAWFYGALAGVLVLGILGVVLLKPDTGSANTRPQPADPTTGAPGDHWHTAFGVNICGQWLPNPPTFETAADNPNVRVGIHTHGDGYLHIHPYTRSEGGTHATLGLFFQYGGWSVSDSSLNVWSGPGSDVAKKSWSDGDHCPPGTPDEGRAGTLRWSVDCKSQTGNPSDYRLKDQQVLAIAFIPKTQSIPVTPNAAVAPASDGTGAGAVATSSCKPSATNNPGVPGTAAAPPTSVPPATVAPGSTPSP